jgi:S-adenosylmethionine:tRNA ribosyltransferase-isomerase
MQRNTVSKLTGYTAEAISSYIEFCFSQNSMRTDELDFDLQPDLIAQTPAADRAASRLLHYRRNSPGNYPGNSALGEISHRVFSDLPGLLRPGDLLVFNDARVIPARFVLRKRTGGRIEGLFVAEPSPGHWQVLLKNLGDAPPGTELHFESDPSLAATIDQNLGGGEFLLNLHPPRPAADLLEQIGRMPLPPYIHREKVADDRDALDRDRYQTIYARSPGAVAAPTAGLHFTPEILRELEERGIQHAMVTLHVGVGTFKPITSDSLEGHLMHSERYSVSREAADMLNGAKSENRRIIAVGTTSARVLESHPKDQAFSETTGETSIFIHPPYAWKHVNSLITNFHLPRSTLIALVAAMTGLQEQRRIYQEAIALRYRFFSYGDAMLIDC